MILHCLLLASTRTQTLSSCYSSLRDATTAALGDDRVDPSSVHNRCIKAATESASEPSMRLLLADPRVNPSEDGYSMLEVISKYQKCSYGFEDKINMLLGHPRIPLKDKMMYAFQKIPNKLLATPIKRLIVLAEMDDTIHDMILTKYVQLKLCSRVRFWWTRLEMRHKVASDVIMAMDPNTDPLLLCMGFEYRKS